VSYETKYPDWKEQVINASKKANSAREAAVFLGIKYDTYKKYAVKYHCFITNQAGKGINKDATSITYPIEDILSGLYPQYPTSKLRIRLIRDKILDNKCVLCGLNDSWNNKPITLQLDHIDGNRYNHNLENLRILCPNCHTQTPTHSARNKKV